MKLSLGLGVLSLLVPVSVLAQPAPPPPPPAPPPPTAGEPAPPPPPPTAPTPTTAPPPAGYQTNYYPPPPQQQPVYTAPSAESLRNGMTFEANIGFGWIHAANDNDSDTSDLGLGGLDIGVGGWINPHLAAGARIAGVTYSDNGARLTSGVLVGALQYWVDDHIWFGGGLGLGVLALSGDNIDGDSVTGLGMDLRAGYTFSTTSENTFNVSVELTPTFLSENNVSARYTSIAFLLGYQHL